MYGLLRPEPSSTDLPARVAKATNRLLAGSRREKPWPGLREALMPGLANGLVELRDRFSGQTRELTVGPGLATDIAAALTAPSRQIILQRLDFEFASRNGADPFGRRDGS